MTEVYLDFDEQGDPIVSVRGAKGKACKALTEGLEKSLGQTVSTELTDEYKEREVSRATERAHNKR